MNDLLAFLNPYRWLAAAVVLAAVASGLWALEAHVEQRGYDRAESIYKAAISAKKAEAAATLASETAKTRAIEASLQELKNHQEIEDASHKKIEADLSVRLRTLAGPAARLRDPNQTGCGGGGGGATSQAATGAGDSANDPAQAGRLLSTQLSGLLQRLQFEADTINDAYASCRADSYGVRAP